MARGMEAVSLAAFPDAPEVAGRQVVVLSHPDPTTALCDGPQALYGDELDALAAACRDLPPLVGRRLVT